MTSDLEIYRTASALIREHGDLDGSAVWRRVLTSIREIQRQEPREGEAVN